MRSFTVSEKGPLLACLYKTLSDTKKTRVKEFLTTKAVSVNGTPTTRFDHPLVPGDKVVIQTNKKALLKPAPAYGVEIIHEDNAIVVIKKPSGLLTVGNETVRERTAIHAVNEYLQKKETWQKIGIRTSAHSRPGGKKIFIVHRLDKDASGLIVLAKTSTIKHKLQENWPEVDKSYYAVVEGTPREKTGRIGSYLRENKFLKVYSTQNPDDAKFSITHYKVIRSTDRYSLLEVHLETGRKHQIRVHLSDLGHPIVGDKVYGAKTDPIQRLALHAYRLVLAHPATDRKMFFQTPLPPEFEKLVK